MWGWTKKNSTMVHIRNAYNRKRVRVQRNNFPWVCWWLCLHLRAVTMRLWSCTQLHSTRPLISLTRPTQHLQGLLPPAAFLSGGWWLVMRLLLCTLLVLFAEMRWVLMHTDAAPCWPPLLCSSFRVFSFLFFFIPPPSTLTLCFVVSETGILWWVMSFVVQDNVTFKNTSKVRWHKISSI